MTTPEPNPSPLGDTRPGPVNPPAAAGASGAPPPAQPAPGTAPGQAPPPAAPPTAAPAARPAPSRPVPSRVGATWVAAIGFAVVLLLLLIFVLQNNQKVEVSFFGAHGNTPMGVALLLAFTVAAGLLGRRLPTSFVPEEDYGYFLLNVQLPPAASLERTDAVCRKIDELLLHTPGIGNFNTIAGFSLLSRVTAGNYNLELLNFPGERRSGELVAGETKTFTIFCFVNRIATRAN